MKHNGKASNVCYFGLEIGLRFLEGEHIFLFPTMPTLTTMHLISSRIGTRRSFLGLELASLPASYAEYVERYLHPENVVRLGPIVANKTLCIVFSYTIQRKHRFLNTSYVVFLTSFIAIFRLSLVIVLYFIFLIVLERAVSDIPGRTI